jgi:hypothetical protein
MLAQQPVRGYLSCGVLYQVWEVGTEDRTYRRFRFY